MDVFALCLFREAVSTGNPDKYRVGAGDETRTRDIFLGKEVLYQLSYTRVSAGGKVEGRFRGRKQFFPGYCVTHTRAANWAAMLSNCAAFSAASIFS